MIGLMTEGDDWIIASKGFGVIFAPDKNVTVQIERCGTFLRKVHVTVNKIKAAPFTSVDEVNRNDVEEAVRLALASVFPEMKSILASKTTAVIEEFMKNILEGVAE